MKSKAPSNRNQRGNEFPGYPIYPASEDIYSQAKEETELDPEDPSRKKLSFENLEQMSDAEFFDFDPEVEAHTSASLFLARKGGMEN